MSHWISVELMLRYKRVCPLFHFYVCKSGLWDTHTHILPSKSLFLTRTAALWPQPQQLDSSESIRLRYVTSGLTLTPPSGRLSLSSPLDDKGRNKGRGEREEGGGAFTHTGYPVHFFYGTRWARAVSWSSFNSGFMCVLWEVGGGSLHVCFRLWGEGTQGSGRTHRHVHKDEASRASGGWDTERDGRDRVVRNYKAHIPLN